MIITCNNKSTPPSQLLNKVGKYIKKRIDGAYSIKFSPNMVDVYITVYYEIPELNDVSEKKTYSDLHEMDFDLNITTYSNKLRFNVIVMDPNERTLGHFVMGPGMLVDMSSVKKTVESKVVNILNKTFDGYEFIF